MRVSADLKCVGPDDVDQLGELISRALLSNLLTEIVAERVVHEFDKMRKDAGIDLVEGRRLTIFDPLLEVAAPGLVLG